MRIIKKFMHTFAGNPVTIKNGGAKWKISQKEHILHKFWNFF